MGIWRAIGRMFKSTVGNPPLVRNESSATFPTINEHTVNTFKKKGCVRGTRRTQKRLCKYKNKWYVKLTFICAELRSLIRNIEGTCLAMNGSAGFCVMTGSAEKLIQYCSRILKEVTPLLGEEHEEKVVKYLNDEPVIAVILTIYEKTIERYPEDPHIMSLPDFEKLRKLLYGTEDLLETLKGRVLNAFPRCQVPAKEDIVQPKRFTGPIRTRSDCILFMSGMSGDFDPSPARKPPVRKPPVRNSRTEQINLQFGRRLLYQEQAPRRHDNIVVYYASTQTDEFPPNASRPSAKARAKESQQQWENKNPEMNEPPQWNKEEEEEDDEEVPGERAAKKERKLQEALYSVDLKQPFRCVNMEVIAKSQNVLITVTPSFCNTEKKVDMGSPINISVEDFTLQTIPLESTVGHQSARETRLHLRGVEPFRLTDRCETTISDTTKPEDPANKHHHNVVYRQVHQVDRRLDGDIAKGPLVVTTTTTAEQQNVVRSRKPLKSITRFRRPGEEPQAKPEGESRPSPVVV